MTQGAVARIARATGTRTLFLAIPYAVRARDVLRSDIYAVLRESGHRIVLLSPAYDDPAFLREFAGLGSEAVIVGSRDHAEIWEPSRWAGYARALDDPDELARALSDLGI